ncbi:MAG: hypothetical protein K2J95_05800 [Lachnospiraceae bacterium]|nr:hypothetical protein [Lachnospiraceae bacterium]MDE6743372.1 hypothetical protein [Lachnospiraceae bacterium]
MVRQHTLRVLSGNRMRMGSIHFNAGGTADYDDPSRDTMILCPGLFMLGSYKIFDGREKKHEYNLQRGNIGSDQGI